MVIPVEAPLSSLAVVSERLLALGFDCECDAVVVVVSVGEGSDVVTLGVDDGGGVVRIAVVAIPPSTSTVSPSVAISTPSS